MAHPDQPPTAKPNPGEEGGIYLGTVSETDIEELVHSIVRHQRLGGFAVVEPAFVEELVRETVQKLQRLQHTPYDKAARRRYAEANIRCLECRDLFLEDELDGFGLRDDFYGHTCLAGSDRSTMALFHINSFSEEVHHVALNMVHHGDDEASCAGIRHDPQYLEPTFDCAGCAHVFRQWQACSCDLCVAYVDAMMQLSRPRYAFA